MLMSLAVLATAQGAASAEGDTTPPAATKIERVGGDYVVAAIDPKGDGDEGLFIVRFESAQPTGRYDVLTLESDHIHVGVKVGQKVRLSAEILSERRPAAEVAQVVIFFKGPMGQVPVWLLSTKASSRDLRAVKYLEMHVPATDYVVM
jgi:hypothetical protein